MRANKETGTIKCLKLRKRAVVAYLDFSCAPISVITVGGSLVKKEQTRSICILMRTLFKCVHL